MIDWREIEDLPGDLAPGHSFRFGTLGKHVFHVTLVVRNGEALCWSRENAGANAAVLLEQDMALVTHFAEANPPEASERRITAAAVGVANLDERCRPPILARRREPRLGWPWQDQCIVPLSARNHQHPASNEREA